MRVSHVTLTIQPSNHLSIHPNIHPLSLFAFKVAARSRRHWASDYSSIRSDEGERNISWKPNDASTCFTHLFRWQVNVWRGGARELDWRRDCNQGAGLSPGSTAGNEAPPVSPVRSRSHGSQGYLWANSYCLLLAGHNKISVLVISK